MSNNGGSAYKIVITCGEVVIASVVPTVYANNDQTYMQNARVEFDFN